MKKKQYVILLAVVLILALAFCGYKYYTYYSSFASSLACYL